MALKPEQIARLTQIVRDASTALAITTMGAKVPKAERDRLVREGYIKLPIAGDLIFDSFAFGQVMQQHAAAQGLSYAEFQNWLKTHPVALSRQEQYAVEVAQNRAGTYCVGLGNRYSEELGRILIDADQELAAKTRGQIQDATATKLAERQTVKQLKSALGHMTGDWKRDWDRIAITESHQAHQEGYLHSVTEEYGDEEMLAKLPEPGACPQCLKHYLEDGRPKVRPASWWHAQGPNNAGRKTADWKPVLGAMHPHCRCALTRVPKGWGFNEAWDLVPKTIAKSANVLDKSHQLFLGPRGGKWADAKHTVSWQPEEAAQPRPAKIPPNIAHHISGPIRSSKLHALTTSEAHQIALKAAQEADPKAFSLPAGARISDQWKPPAVPATAKWAHPDYGDGTGPAPWQRETDWHPDFHKYDYILINSSAGKDSQAMLTHVVAQADKAGFPRNKIIVVHADMGRAEWEGTQELAEQQAKHYGLRFEVVKRERNDLLGDIEERYYAQVQRYMDVGTLTGAGVKTWGDLAGKPVDEVAKTIGAGGLGRWTPKQRAEKLIASAKKAVAGKSKRETERAAKQGVPVADLPIDFGAIIPWPSAGSRFCTSDHKRAEVQKLTTTLADKLRTETGQAEVKVLNALGIRSQEGDAREKMSAFGREEKQSSARKVVDRWFPIHLWHESRVWNTIAESTVPHHAAYGLGMRRLSCAFCVFATKEDLLIAAKYNPKLFAEYVALEARMNERNPTGPAGFKENLSMADLFREIQVKRGEGYDLDKLGEWVKKSYGLEVSTEMIKAITGEVSTIQPMVILAAALERLKRGGQAVDTVVIDWKNGGACLHLDTATDSHHVSYQAYPAAYNASLYAAQFAETMGLRLEENNAPPAQADLEAESVEKAQQLFLGPRGGKWADPQHTVSWHADIMQAPKVAKPEPETVFEREPEFPAHANPIRQRQALVAMRVDVWQARDRIHDPVPRANVKFVPGPLGGEEGGRWETVPGKSAEQLAAKYGTTVAKLTSNETEARLDKEIKALAKWHDLLFDNPRILDPDFKAWFGDWTSGEGSKVVKLDGSPAEQFGQKPIKAFHGTPIGGFKSFSKEKDKGYNIFGKGFYFTEDREIAVQYTKKDDDDKVAFTTHYADSAGREITQLWPDDTAPMLRSLGITKNPNWDPNIVWALIRAEEPAGINIRRMIQEYWTPTGREDPAIVEQVRARVEELQPELTETFNWNGRHLVGYWDEDPFAKYTSNRQASTQIGGAKRMHMLIHTQVGHKAKAVMPKDEVYEVYLNVRKPVDMDKPVPKVELKSLSKYIVRQQVEEVDQRIIRMKLRLNDPTFLNRDQVIAVRKDLVDAEAELAALKTTTIGAVGTSFSVDVDAGALEKLGVKGREIPVTYEALLAVKQHMVKRTAGTSWQGRQILGLLHSSPPSVLTWGDVYYILTDGQESLSRKEEFRGWAEERGYDGIAHTGGWNIGSKAHRVWIAWEPNQIKAADSEGFNPATDDITKSRKLDGRMKFQGFEVSIENAPGSVRAWHNVETGKSGKTIMQLPYGYIRETRGADGDHVDVFVGHDEKAKNVYVIHQTKAPDFKRFDEDKCMLGFPSAAAAKAAYLAHYDNPKFFGSMTALPVEEFRTKVYAAEGRMVKAWEDAIDAVGIPADRFHLVVKYARQGHPESRDALDAVYAELEKAAGYEAYGGGRDISTTGTMGWWGNPARTAGETARHSRQAEPRQDWPLGRPDMKRKRPKHDPDKLPGRIAKVASVKGLRPPGAHHVHQFDLVSNTTSRKLDSDPKNKANLLRTAVGSRQLREAAKLDGPAVQYPPGKTA